MASLFVWCLYFAVTWLVLGLLWKKVIKPYFRTEILHVRTSIIEKEQVLTNRLDDNQCCICLAQPKVFRVAITCGHSFCAACIFQIYKKVNYDQMECPYCRSKIITIFKAFKETQPAELIQQFRQQIKDYNTKFGDDRTLVRTIKQLPFVLTNTVDFIFSIKFLLFFMTNAFFIKCAIGIIIYFSMPFSLLTTSSYGAVGYLDEALIAAVVLVFAVGKIGLNYFANRQ